MLESKRICVVGEAGLEPATPGLEGRCSIQLSYSPLRAATNLLYRPSDLSQSICTELLAAARTALTSARSAQFNASSAALESAPHAVVYAVIPKPSLSLLNARLITRSALQQRQTVLRSRPTAPRAHVSASASPAKRDAFPGSRSM